MYALQQAILNAHTSSNRATTVFPIVYFYAWMKHAIANSD